MIKSTDAVQLASVMHNLRNVSENPELKKQFTTEQLEDIALGDTPSGFTWHHDAETGKMQLVDTNIHNSTNHTGGRNIWGGGSGAR